MPAVMDIMVEIESMGASISNVLQTKKPRPLIERSMS